MSFEFFKCASIPSFTFTTSTNSVCCSTIANCLSSLLKRKLSKFIRLEIKPGAFLRVFGFIENGTSSFLPFGAKKHKP